MINDSIYTCIRKNTCCQDFPNFQQYKLKILFENLFRVVTGIEMGLDTHLYNTNKSLTSHSSLILNIMYLLNFNIL